MSNPVRIQLSRAKGWRMPPNTVKVDRSTAWGNPFNATQSFITFGHRGYPMPCVALETVTPFEGADAPSVARAVDLFTAYLTGRLAADPNFIEPLRGKNLACWCAPAALCHADVLLRVANRTRP